MQVAVTHSKADFDALASLVAATFLYPGALGLLPSQMKPSVREFLGLHRDLFHLATAHASTCPPSPPLSWWTPTAGTAWTSPTT